VLIAFVEAGVAVAVAAAEEVRSGAVVLKLMMQAE